MLSAVPDGEVIVIDAVLPRVARLVPVFKSISVGVVTVMLPVLETLPVLKTVMLVLPVSEVLPPEVTVPKIFTGAVSVNVYPPLALDVFIVTVIESFSVVLPVPVDATVPNVLLAFVNDVAPLPPVMLNVAPDPIVISPAPELSLIPPDPPAVNCNV